MSKEAESSDASYIPLWKDCKRILGMPLSFTKYMVTADRFITQKGFFSTETNEILLYRILDIKLVRSFGQKIFGVGTITLYSADKSDSKLVIENIKKPDDVRKFLSRLVEQVRATRGLAGREIYGAAAISRGHEGKDLGDWLPADQRAPGASGFSSGEQDDDD